MVRTPQLSPIITVGVPRGGVCEGVCGDSCDVEDDEEE